MCLSKSAEINEEHQRLGDEIVDIGSESMSFDNDDIEVLEEYASATSTSQPSSDAAVCESSVSVSPTSQPSRPLETHINSGRRPSINFQWPLSARKIDGNHKPARQRVPPVRHEIDDNGYCVHHPDIQLYRRRSEDDNDWRVVRKKCPNCISNERPSMLGDSGESDKALTNSEDKVTKSNMKRSNSFVQSIVNDFSPNGDQKILRAVGRTATVNAAVLLTAATGGVGASAIGYVTGGAITAKRLSDGVAKKDEKEITKSSAVFGAATGASIAGQALTGALMIGVAGASLPVAGAVAFGVGCASGISAGALSEWSVDGIMDKRRRKRGEEVARKSDDSEGSESKSVEPTEALSGEDSFT